MKRLVSGLFSSISDAELFAAMMGHEDLADNEVSDSIGAVPGAARSSDDATRNK